MDIARKLDYWKLSTESIVQHTDVNSSVRLATLDHMIELLAGYKQEIANIDQAAIDAVLNAPEGDYSEPPVWVPPVEPEPAPEPEPEG